MQNIRLCGDIVLLSTNTAFEYCKKQYFFIKANFVRTARLDKAQEMKTQCKQGLA